MVYRYVSQSFLYLNRSGPRWKPAGIYYGNATARGGTSGKEIAGSK